jgi:hypothetical protein
MKFKIPIYYTQENSRVQAVFNCEQSIMFFFWLSYFHSVLYRKKKAGRKPGKWSRIVPLVTVTEGIRSIGTHRNATVEPEGVPGIRLRTAHETTWRSVNKNSH